MKKIEVYESALDAIKLMGQADQDRIKELEDEIVALHRAAKLIHKRHKPEYNKIRQQATERDKAQKTHCGEDI